MNRVIAAFKKIRLGPILMTFLVGILLFVSTACSKVQAQSPDAAVQGRRQEVPAGKLAVPGKPENPRPEVPGGTATSPSSDVINTFQGGPSMNDFTDVDPRAKNLEKAATDKAAALKENAERNVIDQTSNVGENTKRILDKKGENAEDFGKNIQENVEGAKDKAQGTTEDLVSGTKRGTRNIKDNTLDATEGVNRSVSRAGENVKDAAKDVSRSAKNATDDVNKSANRASDDVKGTFPDLTKGVKQAVENTSNYLQGKVDQTADSVQRNLD